MVLFCQGSIPRASGSEETKDIGCIIVDRCIDFLDVYGLLLLIGFWSSFIISWSL